MYNHDEDGFEQFAKELGMTDDPIQLNMTLPAGETLIVRGTRLNPTIITVSNTVEKNPKRDARMLAAVLATSLDEQTLFLLAEYMFAEHLAPLMQDRTEKEIKIPPIKRKKEITE